MIFHVSTSKAKKRRKTHTECGRTTREQNEDTFEKDQKTDKKPKSLTRAHRHTPQEPIKKHQLFMDVGDARDELDL